MRPQRKAGPSALQGVRPRTNQRIQVSEPRVIVPMLEDLVSGVSAVQLQSVRAQVEAGERVGIYRHGERIRVLLAGPQRLHRVLPVLLEGEWVLVGAVEITADGERSLPVRVS